MSFNNILVVGNGFDLALGYSTRYIDFINFIKLIRKIDVEENNDNVKSFVNRFRSRFSEISKNERFDEFVKIINDNCFVEHFIDVNFDINIWSDVEQEMHRIVSTINNVFNDTGINSGKVEFDTIGNKTGVKSDDLYIVKTLLEFNITMKNSYNDIDRVFYELNSEYYDCIYKTKWKQLIKHLVAELEGFKKVLIIYLKEFVPIMVNQNFDTSTDKQIREEINPDSIINFNYTSYCDDIYGIDSLHVHGDLKEEKIVLGFEEDNQLSLKYVRFSKYFQRIQNRCPIIKNDNGIFHISEDDPDLKAFPIKDNIIHFYGLSFDKTDEDYIKEIYESKKNNIICVYYYDDEDYDNKILNLISIFGKDRITNDVYYRKLNLVPIAKENKM